MQKILRLCCDADWSPIIGRRLSNRDPVFALIAQNVVSNVRNKQMKMKPCKPGTDGVAQMSVSIAVGTPCLLCELYTVV